VLAEDISDFQIEGMSVGDSLLDYFSEEEIKNKVTDFYNYHSNNNFYSVEFYNNFKIYDAVEVILKTSNKDYIIQGLAGGMFYSNNIDACYDERKKIVKELKNIFVNAKVKGPMKLINNGDNTGNSFYYGTWFFLEDGVSQVSCYDWSKEMPYIDHLKVTIITNEFEDWLNSY